MGDACSTNGGKEEHLKVTDEKSGGEEAVETYRVVRC
jgi:hypothetical protein